jgi:hypothetical protein
VKPLDEGTLNFLGIKYAAFNDTLRPSFENCVRQKHDSVLLESQPIELKESMQWTLSPKYDEQTGSPKPSLNLLLSLVRHWPFLN